MGPSDTTGAQDGAPVPAIRIGGLHKSFGDNHVLRGIDFVVGEGEVVCVIGPSGSGKSTLLRCVNRLEEADEGSILIEGADIRDPDADVDLLRTSATRTRTWTCCAAASAWCSSRSTCSRTCRCCAT